MKGVYLTSGTVTRTHRKERFLHQEGIGALVVTDKRIAFANHGGHGSNWAKTWNGIHSWKGHADAIIVQGTSGRPKVFVLPNSGLNPSSDAQLVEQIISHASADEDSSEA